MNTNYRDWHRLDWFTLLLTGPLAILAIMFAFNALEVGGDWLWHFLTRSLDQFDDWAASIKLGYLCPDFCQSVTGFVISAGLSLLLFRLRYGRWW
jgi:hypothetical protein